MAGLAGTIVGMDVYSRTGLGSAVVAVSVVLSSFVAAPAAVAGADPSVVSQVRAWAGSDLSGSQWGLSAIDARRAWGVSTGSGVTVAVIDTGVDGEHPDLAGNTVPGFLWSAKTDSKGRSSFRLLKASAAKDFDGHGTHVAGIVAASANGAGTTGVAPSARVLPINFFPVMANAGSYRAFARPLARSITALNRQQRHTLD